MNKQMLLLIIKRKDEFSLFFLFFLFHLFFSYNLEKKKALLALCAEAFHGNSNLAIQVVVS